LSRLAGRVPAPISRRRRLRRLAYRCTLALWVSMSGMRRRQGLAAWRKALHLRMRRLRQADLGEGRHNHEWFETAFARMVLPSRWGCRHPHLEHRWNEAMQRLRDLEAELASFEQQTLRAVTAEQKRQILQLAQDFPRLWAAATTTSKDRKRILRLLVRDITVSKGRAPKVVNLHVRWQGGGARGSRKG